MRHPLKYETVALPVVKGIDVTTKARLVAPPGLLEAINSRFPVGGGATKRRGHLGRRVRGTKALPVGVTLPELTPPAAVAPYYTGDRGIPEDWLLGWGPLVATNRASIATSLETSEHPDAGLLFGSFARDAETVAWNGHQLFTRLPGQDPGTPFGVVGNAMFPAARMTPVGKLSRPQSQPDAADTGTIRVVTWLDTPDADIWYTVLDSVSGAVLVAPTALGFIAPLQARVVSVGGWVHILVVESDTSTLQCRSIHESDVRTVASQSLGACHKYFDVFKESNTAWWVAINTGALGISVLKRNADGTVAGDSPTYPIVITLAGVSPTVLYTVAIAVHPTSGDIGLVWRGTYSAAIKALGKTYVASGIGITDSILLATCDNADRPVAVAAKYVLDSSGQSVFNSYVDDVATAGSGLLTGGLLLTRFAGDEGGTYTTTKFHTLLASAAFRVGDRTFVWGAHKSAYQSLWVLLDEELNPVGRADYSVANVPAPEDFPWVTSVNWTGAAAVKDLVVFHCALGYRVRVPTEAPTPNANLSAVYTEPSVHYVDLDFLPKLSTVQAGRCAFVAGAQLWNYDGSALVENGFHIGPENIQIAAVTGGSLTTTGVYTWRVDLCHRNAQGEEVRSLSFFSDETTLAGSDKQVTLTIATCLTRRTDAYFLIFRNASAGTQWYLVNSRDPSSALYLKNDQDFETLDFVDDGVATPTDAALVSQELHPGNSGFGYIPPVSAPACELVAYGKNRLWVAGGEVPPGQVMPSRLFEVGDVPAFHPNLGVQIDRTSAQITAIGFIGDIVSVFHANSTYILDGDGVDNVSQGGWSTPRLSYADSGAVSQAGLALIGSGLLFQAPVGFQLLTQGGGVKPGIGDPTNTLVADLDIAAVMVSGGDQEVRWYTVSGGAVIYNYGYDMWSTWTVAAVGATRNPATGLAIVATPDGYLWEETEGLWADNSAPYKHRIRFAWLRGGDLMDFQRVRRIGALGTWDGADHSVHVDVYYDERDFAEETFDWDMPADAESSSWNTDTFGSDNFGDGVLGDS